VDPGSEYGIGLVAVTQEHPQVFADQDNGAISQLLPVQARTHAVDAHLAYRSTRQAKRRETLNDGAIHACDSVLEIVTAGLPGREDRRECFSPQFCVAPQKQ
jgi:hypothetical protein